MQQVVDLLRLQDARLTPALAADEGSFDESIASLLRMDLIHSSEDARGEILYFERGSGNGNSWIKMQAVDENGAALGPWLVVGPNETLQTTPQTAVYRMDQKMGTTAIDVSRLGVSEFEYLRISNVVKNEPAYTGGGDQNPDFKLMVVMTNEEQLAQLFGGYD